MALYAFDGTWNEEKDAGVYGASTNVVEFARAYDGRLAVVQAAEGDGEATVRDDFYLSGVGTRHGRLGRWFGGAFGVGGRSRIKEARKAVAERMAAGDDVIDVVGFSRGAALALHFTNVLAGETFRDRHGHAVRPRVRFLGLWDVVASFGIPLNVGRLRFQRINLGYELRLPDGVDHCFHALALDEKRNAFRPTRVDDGYQVWFRGTHSDVGGGNGNAALSNIALAWMLRKARAVGLPVDATIPDRLAVDAAARVRASTLGPATRFRDVAPTDRVHHTAGTRTEGDCQNAPDGCAVECAETERGRVLTVRELRELARRPAA